MMEVKESKVIDISDPRYKIVNKNVTVFDPEKRYIFSEDNFRETTGDCAAWTLDCSNKEVIHEDPELSVISHRNECRTITGYIIIPEWCWEFEEE